MKYLKLIDHNGIERHVFQVFVEGQDFEYEFPEPVALWFGKLQLVDVVPEPEIPLAGLYGESRYIPEMKSEEVQFEPETAITAGSGDAGATPSDALEGAEVTPENSDSGAASKGSKRDKGAKKS